MHIPVYGQNHFLVRSKGAKVHHFRFQMSKKVFHAALSKQFPFLDILGIMWWSLSSLWYWRDVYGEPWSLWRMTPRTSRFFMASFTVSITNSKLLEWLMRYAMISLLYKSLMAERYKYFPWNGKYVISVTHFWLASVTVKSRFNTFETTIFSVLFYTFSFFAGFLL